MKLKEQTITVTTVGGGTGTGTSKPIFGRLYAVYWDDGTFADGVDGTFTYVNPIADTITLLTLTDANTHGMYYPREQVHDNAGAALWYEAANSEMVAEMPIVDGIVTLTIAQGGATKTGGATLYYYEGYD